jgi:phosphoribosylaminoimidazole-succinocarboxamide synthase
MTAADDYDIPELNLLFRGKVRDMYDLGDQLLLMVATDRISAYDVVLPTRIPDKGRVLTQLSRFWFECTKDIVSNHLIDVPLNEVIFDLETISKIHDRALVVHKTRPLPIEAVVRGYLAGSGWAEYRETGSVCGIRLPAGLHECDRLPEPIFTPSTKAAPGEHDENISFDETVERVGGGVADAVLEASLALYCEAAFWAERCGILLADTKFEFGVWQEDVLLIDEAITPDSSRFWNADEFKPGQPQPNFDKQFVRDYLDSIGWDRSPPAPALPARIVGLTQSRYLEALERLVAPDLIAG